MDYLVVYYQDNIMHKEVCSTKIWKNDDFKFKNYNWRAYPVTYDKDSYGREELIASGDKNCYEDYEDNLFVNYKK